MDAARAGYEESLYEFLKAAWRYFDPSPWQDGWCIEAIAEHLQAVVDGQIRRLIVNIPPRCSKSSLLAVAFPAWCWAQSHRSVTSGAGVRFLFASYAAQLSRRDSLKCARLMASPWYQQLWGDRFTLVQDTAVRITNDVGGERLITSIPEGTATGEGADIFCCDDPNSAKSASSEATIEATNDWWDQTASTRLNDPKRGAFVICQQRLAEEDMTGHVLERNVGDWTHLVLPMHYESDRSFVTVLGYEEDGSPIQWKDPRTQEGELIWPDRFGDEEVRILEQTLGPWACNPTEAPVLMADLSMKPIGDVRIGDEIIGFDKRQAAEGRSHGRHKLTPAWVLEVHKRRAPVVKITLEHGDVIRCTPDHKWYTKDRGSSREMYLPATLRSRLARICPAELPTLEDEEDLREAGWLAGFFDGEGTVSVCKQNGFASSNSIHIFQGAGRNLPLCEKLERVLTKFGFDWVYTEDERKPNKDAPCYGYRTYTIRQGDGIGVVQKFLHLIKPEKWRDRLIEGTYRSNFIKHREKVLSIEPDGEEEVFALTTTTGNYVVWGLASSNSAGQLEQRPEPKGGGIIKRDWWNLWSTEAFPPMSYVLASLDTAYTEKTENDPSAMTIWGVFRHNSQTQPTRRQERGGFADQVIDPRTVYDAATYAEEIARVMLMGAWREWLELHDLVDKVVQTCREMKVDHLLIEAKASGISVAQEIRRLYRHETFAVQLIDPKTMDKVARLHSTVPIFAPEVQKAGGKTVLGPDGRPVVLREGLVWAPDRTWSDMVMTEVGLFPKGKRKDLTDTTSQALRWLRDTGMLQLAPERLAEIDEARQYENQKAPGPLYPV